LEDGFKPEDLATLVNNNLSFYQDFMPQPWKEAVLQGLGPEASSIGQIDEDTLSLLVEAISEELPWFAKIVTYEKRQWLKNEVELIRKDLQACREK
jgi:hypothetical protein